MTADTEPDPAKRLKRLAWRLTEAGDRSAAEEAWRNVLAAAPHDLQAHMALARALHDLGRPIEAIPHLRAATDAGSGGVKACRRLAHALQLAGDPEGAEAAWRRSIQVGGGDAYDAAALGALILAAGRPAEAVDHLRVAAESGHWGAEAWVRLAQALEQAGDPPAALMALESAVEAAPDDVRVRYRLASGLSQARLPDRAAPHLRVLAEADAGSAKAWRRLGRALEEAGDLPGAAAAWRRVAELDPKLGQARLDLLNERLARVDRPKRRRSSARLGGVGPAVDLFGPLPLRSKADVLARTERPSDLARSSDTWLAIDAGGRPIEHDPIIPLTDDGGYRFKARAATAEAFVLGLDNAAVVNRGAVITQAGDVIGDVHRSVSASYGATVEAGEVLFSRGVAQEALDRIKVFDTPAFLMAGPMDLSFGDWIDNYFNRLALADAAELDCAVLVRPDLPPQMFDTLAALGVGRDRILHHDPRGLSIFPRLYVPSWPIPTRERLMRQVYGAYGRASLTPPDTDRPLLYISRQGMPSRRLLNEDEVVEAFVRRGFQVIHPERLSFQEMQVLFAQPACIAGPYGSAMRNAVFCSRKPVCLNLLPPVSHAFRRWVALWMAEAGVRVGFVEGVAGPDWRPPVQSGTWTVPLERVERALDQVLLEVGRGVAGPT